ncbi:MAG: hypothetical protein AAGC46_01205 [Solirubrobacteraceae bacterium]|nr:hypothetical protein [Patulibacter sp.]
MPRTSPLRAVFYVLLSALLIATAVSWHVSVVATALLAILAAFAVELMAPDDE